MQREARRMRTESGTGPSVPACPCRGGSRIWTACSAG